MTDPEHRERRFDVELLIESLKYIREFRGHVFVIRCAPNLTGEGLLALCKDIAMLRYVGVRAVVVHPYEEADPAGPTAGRPRPNHRLVHALGEFGQATGLSGSDGAPRWLISQTEDGETAVNSDLVRHVIDDYTPVIEAVAVNHDGDAVPADPDIAAAKLAVALEAYKVLFVVGDHRVSIEGEGDISEMRNSPDVVSRVSYDEALSGPFDAARLAIDSGRVTFAHLVPDNSPHAVLLELFTDRGFGTKLRSPTEWSIAEQRDGFPPSGYFCWDQELDSE